MRKNRSFVLAALLSALLLMACFSGTLLSASKFPELDANGRFLRTRSITVEVYDRGNPGGSKPEDNFFANWIKEGMLRDHNVKVTFKPVPRWTEVEVINNLLAAGDAPDICVTYDYPTILTYANMGGVLDMSPYLTDEYKELLPDLWSFLGEEFLFWNRDPVTGTVWAIEARLFQNKRINTFVREDWLKKLNLPEPRSLEEFENMLRAFKANAQLLLGKDADKLIPYTTSYDIGWRNEHLILSFVPESITDKEMYIYGFDDRRLLWPGYKEGVRKLNQWYNEGLIWKDFPIYGPGDGTEDNNMKAGYVGAFMHNWDYPYRNGKDSIHYQLQQMAGPDAAFIAVEPFKNDAGIYRKYLAPANDRKVFFPATNDEPLASMLYLNWITKLENRRFLQIGVEGVNHKVLADGSIQNIAATGEMIMNSLQNIDYTITINGLDLGDPALTAKSLALGYDLVDKRFIERAYRLTDNNARYTPHYNVGEIKSEEGMGPALAEKRNNFLVQAVVAKPEDFDRVFDAGMRDYLNSGGQAIINERRAKYEQYFE